MKPSEKTAQEADKNIDQRRAAADERIAELFAQHVDKSFMRENFIGLGETLWRYLVLKDAYKMGDVGKWRDFQKAFSKFYAIQRFISPEWHKRYYKEMEHLKGKKIPEVSAITEQLTDKWDKDGNMLSAEKVQFSFVTKMLNIMDDSEYPIYDTNVCTAFGLKHPYATELNDKIRKYVESYNIIRSVSKNMIKLQVDRIELFRNIFKNNEISNLRIIDLIIWKLGEKMLKGEIKIAKNKRCRNSATYGVIY